MEGEGRSSLKHAELDPGPWGVHRNLREVVPSLWRAEWWWWWNRRRAHPKSLSMKLPGFGEYVTKDPEEFSFLMFALHSSRRLFDTLPSEGDIRRLLDIRRDIVERLKSGFSSQEIDQCSTGGWPGIKEALLYVLIRNAPVDLVVETGVAQGVSSYFILSALEANNRGKLVSIDLPNRDPKGYSYPTGGVRDRVYTKLGSDPGWLVPAALKGRWDLQLGPAQEILPKLQVKPDLFLHDSLHTYEHITLELNWAWERSGPGSLIACDDMDWNNAFTDFATRHQEEVTVICRRKIGLIARKGTPRTEIRTVPT